MKQSRKITNESPVMSLMAMPNGGGSDIALKKNVTEIMAALERILALRTVTWQWKTDSNEQLQHGFIAQEVEEVFPELVETKEDADGNSYKYLRTKELIPYMVKALEEQQQQIDALRLEIEARKAKNKNT